MPKPCIHGLVICEKCVVVTDAAKRIHDAIGLALVSHDIGEASRGWMAFRLQDGTTDNVLYPSQTDARNHQLDENRCCYIWLRTCLGGMPVKDAQLFLDAMRQAASNGYRMKDPRDAIIFPQGREQLITRPTFQRNDDWTWGTRYRG